MLLRAPSPFRHHSSMQGLSLSTVHTIGFTSLLLQLPRQPFQIPTLPTLPTLQLHQPHQGSGSFKPSSPEADITFFS
ncbi:hypothetical protein N656DRAFT_383205 [Canariomyces notabilis]|uniref:Uncharacterized protein n=1 Tax=Canariomyces notabilis TaxID=2074819 RepID=A0AAN6YVP8_9PEZI|nr:hypothetical protein N656DRAFT_383205 [Canariomyces arenarius]